jgi:hypothetical protein
VALVGLGLALLAAMQGLINESHFEKAERCFPGIRRFYFSLAVKPATFLELVWEYEKAHVRLSREARSRSSRPIR